MAVRSSTAWSLVLEIIGRAQIGVTQLDSCRGREHFHPAESGDWLWELPEAERGGLPRNDRHYFAGHDENIPNRTPRVGSSTGDFGGGCAVVIFARRPVAVIARQRSASPTANMWTRRIRCDNREIVRSGAEVKHDTSVGAVSSAARR
ncbi:hypothetical protein [Micromonospora purpureochromogenes]|uniref:Uncharacterized protein n=1 Tax=Micromonospora purpureochromogenes TaxID=47872 RepID=A0ABX2RX30_9ACTN|nr:hypothetical protein [Micromonospora purpureochromogenes]NYF59877.1 hypothetical protein [Micromonospora purpureochromogenes]